MSLFKNLEKDLMVAPTRDRRRRHMNERRDLRYWRGKFRAWRGKQPVPSMQNDLDYMRGWESEKR